MDIGGLGLKLNDMCGLSRTRAVHEGRRYFCVPAASSERQLWPSILALYVEQCQLCVVVYSTRGLCHHVEVHECKH